ncbi:MAG: hypothetical protein KatS3mg077_0908 [Candidatus Binatia bacterium]|nr:MAG: hypothetical protein KatS3mg077_0908 [Candidatus Binatia bacterium]
MARLPYPEVTALPQDVRDALEQLPVQLNVFRMLAHAATCFRPWLRLGTAILNELELDARLRELVILAVARETTCTYEWQQHAALARLVGVTDAQLAAVECGDDRAACFSDLEQLVLDTAKGLLKNARLGDEIWQRLVRAFSPRQIVELCLVVGFYAMLARVLETTEVDLDAPFADTLKGTRKQ